MTQPAPTPSLAHITQPHARATYDEDATHRNQIPIQNLWLLMLYASDLRHHPGLVDVSVEKPPADIPELVAHILTQLISQRLRRNLNHGYHEKNNILRRVRGRIDILKTTSNRLLDRAQIACTYEELTTDTPRNRLVRTALDKLAKILSDKPLAHLCRQHARTLRQLGVRGPAPTRTEISTLSFNRNDAHDRPMVAAAQLAIQLAIPTQTTGAHRLFAPGGNIHWLRKLYEKAIAGFCHFHLTPLGWSVQAGTYQNWPVQQQTAGLAAILPAMQTDIILDHRELSRRIVIDTKFTAITKPGHHRKQTLSSAYIYQMYAYLRSQEESLAPRRHSTGLLLHPAVHAATDTDFDEAALLQNHELRFATVNLAASPTAIYQRLLQIIHNPTFPHTPL